MHTQGSNQFCRCDLGLWLPVIFSIGAHGSCVIPPSLRLEGRSLAESLTSVRSGSVYSSERYKHDPVLQCSEVSVNTLLNQYPSLFLMLKF